MRDLLNRLLGLGDTPVTHEEPACDHVWERTQTKRLSTGFPASYDRDDGEFIIETAEFIMEWTCEKCDTTTHPSPKHGPPKIEGTEWKHRADEVESWEVSE